MPETYLDSWSRFAITKPCNEWTSACQQLDVIYHVAHIESALSIARQGKIQAGLIYDDSHLNKYRILVTWLSPNYWVQGSRYGHVRFHLDWKSLISDKHYYWVGAMEMYHPSAVRILITKQEHPSLKRYDPTLANGPWWYDATNDRHFWNGAITLEFMLEDDILLSDVIEVDFVEHHPTYCSLETTCLDQKLSRNKAMARFLAGFISQLPEKTDFPWISGSISPMESLAGTFSALCFRPSRNGFSGKITASDPDAFAVMRAFMASKYFRREQEAEVFRRMFHSSDDFLRTCVGLIEKQLGLGTDSLKGLLP